MRITKELKDPTKWHLYFAWMPVLIEWNNTKFQCVWLEVVERRKVYLWTYTFYEYRLKDKE